MIEFHWTTMIVIFGFCAIPFFARKFSVGQDTFGIGAMMGFFVGTIIFLFSICVVLALKLWVFK